MIETWFTQDLKQAVQVQYINGNVFSQDNEGNKIGVCVYSDGEEATVTGSISGNVIRSDGATVAVEGSSSGNQAWVVLPQAAYAVPGVISVIIKQTVSSAVTTLCAVVANVYQTSTDTVVDPGTIVPDISTLIAAIDAAVDSIPLDYSELWDAVSVNESLLNNGKYTIKTSDLESGSWSYTTKTENSKRIRSNRLMPVRNGMKIYYSNPTLQFTVGVFATQTATSYAQSTGWIDAGGSGVVTINSDGYMIIMCQSTNNITVSDYDCTVTIKTAIEETSIISRGILPDGSDINDATLPGCYVLTSGYTYSHNPLPSGVGGVLVVYTPYSTIVKQTVYSISTAANVFERTALNGSFYAWAEYDFVGRKTIIPDNTDFDTLTLPGTYLFNSGYTYTHSPFSSSYGGTLIVFPQAYPGSFVQIAITYSENGGNIAKVRMGINNSYPSSWANIGGNIYNNNYTTESYNNSYTINCSPTITTDTNNYLASTGDTTDRTGDIQTMLNTTGICRLGAGVFYVTGVEIPTYGMLCGSGNSSRIILAGSVTTGYAVKLKNYGCVKDVRISGSASEITIPSAIGTRHGVIFEGTANAESNPATFYRSSVHNCTISDLEGGGITCYNTGLSPASNLEVSNCFIYRCGAGINISYYSEFHRVTNVCAQNCLYGCINNGGNNNFANCDFSSNTTGLLIDNSSGQSRNNSHGSFVGCTFNHSGNNSGTAIRILGAENGEVFTASQIFYGAIVIDNSIGIRFIGANIGRSVPITVTDSKAVTFDNCTMYDATNNPVTQSGNTSFVFNGCYLYNGNAYNPIG